MMRDLQGMQRCLQEKEDPPYLKGRQTHIKSKLDLRRWNQRSSISHELKVFQRSQGMQVIFAKDDQRILQLHRFSEGFHGVLGLNLHGISVAGGVLIYVGISARWYSLVSVKGVEEGLKKIGSCGFLMEWICENEELLVQGRVRLNRWQFQIEIDSGWKHRFFASKVFLASCVKRRDLLAIAAVQSDVQGKGFWFEAVVIQVLHELQVSIDISGKFGEEESINL
ncbi:hypothetical protein DY000_02021073 [Brassica cretica]|uniref:Uncharacterized protein n=1 Tax=Brassica cretica TaxID=69181 RepID=A0ABQ7EI21_BRACR|nr:hypothetical protein DY000_02021073 [Brassica cretica]